MADRIFGDIDGIPEGSSFDSRQSLHNAGVHGPTMAGIWGSAKEGAGSIVMSGGFEDDEDYGDLIIYTGHGGQDAATKKQIADRVGDLLTEVGLNPYQANLYPHEFSGGQRQRIGIARALSLNPELIILDEPVSALDVSIRAQIMNLLVDLQKEHNLSYLLIAHNLATVRYMCHRVGVMYLGKIVEHGDTDPLFDNALHPYTKALISAALPSHPDIVREEIILPGEVPSPINPPSGCTFNPRCPMKIGDLCEQVPPKLADEEKRHAVSCHLYTNSLEAAQAEDGGAAAVSAEPEPAAAE